VRRGPSLGLVVSILLGVPLVVAAPWIARWAAPLLSPDPEVAKLGAIYLHYRFYGAAFSFFSWVYAAFFAGIGRTRHQFGELDPRHRRQHRPRLPHDLRKGRLFPRSEWLARPSAANVALGVGVAYYVGITLLPSYRRTYAPYRGGRFRRPMDPAPLSASRFRSTPNGFSRTEAGFAFFLITSRIGTLELAATNVIRSIYSAVHHDCYRDGDGERGPRRPQSGRSAPGRRRAACLGGDKAVRPT